LKSKPPNTVNVQVDNSVFVAEKVRILTPSTYVLRFSRNDMEFNPGQHLVLGLPGSDELREYSIYSGTGDPYLEVLIKEVDEGMVSRQLRYIRPGGKIEVKGPHGFFMGNAYMAKHGRLYFIASGTGIAPFHSFVKSHPHSDYQLIHGIKTIDEAYDAVDYDPERLVTCTSRDNQGSFEGRLTEYLPEAEIHPDGMVYLCGNSQMIYDAMEILLKQGIPQRHLFTEVYF
jgi:ferredoxin--NADP+ reductase/benzoate/toluate 1,2-dioxygenase reductase subunit